MEFKSPVPIECLPGVSYGRDGKKIENYTHKDLVIYQEELAKLSEPGEAYNKTINIKERRKHLEKTILEIKKHLGI